MVLGFLGCEGRVGVARVKRRRTARQSSRQHPTGRREQILLCAQHLIGTCADRVTWHASISVLLLAPGVHK